MGPSQITIPWTGIRLSGEQKPTEGPRPSRFETLEDIRNKATNVAPINVDNRPLRSIASVSAPIYAAGRKIASSLCIVAMLPSASANAEEGLITGSALAHRSYGAAQIMRDHPVAGTFVLITATAMVCGSLYGLLRPSIPAKSPFAAAQNSLGATPMAGCHNLMQELPSTCTLSLDNMPQFLQELDHLDAAGGKANDLLNLVKGGTTGIQAASLASIRECIQGILARMGELRAHLSGVQLHIGLGGYGIEQYLPEASTRVDGTLKSLATSREKIREAETHLTQEINRQRSRSNWSNWGMSWG